MFYLSCTFRVQSSIADLPGRCPDAEFVAIGVGELCPFTPGFSAQLLGKRDSTSFERRTGFFYIVGMQDKASETCFVTATLAAQPKHEMGLCSGRSDFEPALRFAHRLVVDRFEAKLVDLEVERFVLVADADSDGTEFREHIYLLFVDRHVLFIVYPPGPRKTTLIFPNCSSISGETPLQAFLHSAVEGM